MTYKHDGNNHELIACKIACDDSDPIYYSLYRVNGEVLSSLFSPRTSFNKLVEMYSDM